MLKINISGDSAKRPSVLHFILKKDGKKQHLEGQMRNYKNSIGPEDARKDFRTRMRPEMLPDTGHQKDAEL